MEGVLFLDDNQLSHLGDICGQFVILKYLPPFVLWVFMWAFQCVPTCVDKDGAIRKKEGIEVIFGPLFFIFQKFIESSKKEKE